MALTRAQLLMGDNAQGVVLPGQVQGVKQSSGISIAADGSISVDSQTIIGVMKLGQTAGAAAAAYNAYNFPNVTGAIGQQLTIISVGGGVTGLAWGDPDQIPWTTKGQLVVGTGPISQTLLDVGTDGTFLIADSSTASGLDYVNTVLRTTEFPTFGAAILPAGTTANQPSPAAAGYLRFNSDTGKMEVYSGTSWENVPSSSTTSFVPQTSDVGSAILPDGTQAERDASPASGYLRYNSDTDKLEFYAAAAWETLASASATGFVSETSATGSAVLPSGTDAQRDASPSQGYLRFNTTNNRLEAYIAGIWQQIASSDPAFNFVPQTVPTVPVNATPSAVFPAGTTAQRQGAPAPQAGYARFNTDTTLMEVFNGTLWVPIGAPPSIGLGLDISGAVPNQILKVSIPQQATPPVPGILATEAVVGSMYWDDVTGQLYIYYSNGGAPAWVQAAASAAGTGVISFSGGTTGLTPAVASAGAITLGGVLSIANGGTGATTQAAAAAAVLPSQAGNAGEYLTTDGTTTSWAPVVSIPAGTTMLFAQAAAPTGWVQVTSAAYNDSSLRMVTSAGGGTGGTIAFSTLFSPTSTYTGSVTITSGTVGATTLSAAQLASHRHTINTFGSNGSGSGNLSMGVVGQQFAEYNIGSPLVFSSPIQIVGSSSSHTHSLVGAAAGGTFTSDFNVKYVNIIACTKS